MRGQAAKAFPSSVSRAGRAGPPPAPVRLSDGTYQVVLTDVSGTSCFDEGPIIRLRPSLRCACPRAAKVLGTATAVGLLTGFFGVGGGFVVVPALVLVLGFSMPMAVGPRCW